MEDFLFLVLAAFIDPIRAILVLAVILMWRGPWAILLATFISAVATDSHIPTPQLMRAWGAGIIAGSIGSLLQAWLFYRLVQFLRQRRESHANRTRES